RETKRYRRWISSFLSMAADPERRGRQGVAKKHGVAQLWVYPSGKRIKHKFERFLLLPGAVMLGGHWPCCQAGLRPRRSIQPAGEREPAINAAAARAPLGRHFQQALGLPRLTPDELLGDGGTGDQQAEAGVAASRHG